MVGLIKAALDEAEREAARTEETAAGQPGQADSQPETNADAPDEEPETDAEGEAETEEDREETEEEDGADGSQSPEGN